MVFLNKVDFLGFRDWIKQHFPSPSRGCASEVPIVFEQLEPRILLSGDCVGFNPTPIDLFQNHHEPAIVVDLVPGGGEVISEQGEDPVSSTTTPWQAEDDGTADQSGSSTVERSVGLSVSQLVKAANLYNTQNTEEYMLAETAQSSSDSTVMPLEDSGTVGQSDSLTVERSNGLSVSQIETASNLSITQQNEIQSSSADASEDLTLFRPSHFTLQTSVLGTAQNRGPPAGTQDNSTVSNTTTYIQSDEITDTSDTEDANSHQPLATSHLQALSESLDTLKAPELPGLELIDSDVSKLTGQVIYLDFDGAEEVVYDGPVTVGLFDVPAFAAPDELAGQEDVIITQVVEELEETFAGLGIVFTTQAPTAGQPFSTIYIGGDDRAFAEYGEFLGLSEQVDVGNGDPSDDGFVFSEQIESDELAAVVAHEIGHLLGYEHEDESECSAGNGLEHVAAVPTLTEFTSVLETTSEDTPVEITFSEIVARSDVADSDGTVEAFIIDTVFNGSLAIGTDAGSATPWADTNDTLEGSNNLYWIPPSGTTGTLDVFTVVAVDNDSDESTPAVTAQIEIIGGGGDTTAPAAVTDLSHTNVTSSSVELTWSAPADDGANAGSGAAGGYDVRYATAPINDEASWSQATGVAGEPQPQVYSSTESLGVYGLSPNTTYHFALKTRDEASNWSDLSNSYSVSTTESFGRMMGPNHTLDALDLDELHVYGDNLVSITVDIIVPDGSGFDPATHLAPLSTDSASGVYLVKDNKTEGGGQGWLDPLDDFNDTPLTLASVPTWSQPTSGVYRTILTLATADVVPSSSDTTGSDYFVGVQTSGSPVPNDTFKVQIPIDGITVDSTTAFNAAYPAGPQTITIAQGGQMGAAVMISEVQAQGGTDTDEFIELHNRRDYAVDLSNYSIQYVDGVAELSQSSQASKVNLTGMIQANGYLLIASSDGYDGATAADISYSTSSDFALSHEGGTVFLVNTQDAIVSSQSGSIESKVAWGSASGGGSLYPEGSAASAPAANGSLERKAFSDSTPSSMASGGIDATMGNSYDSYDNGYDFISRSSADPQNTSSATESSELSGDYPVVINEFLYNGDAQWIELYNNDTDPVDIANWELETAVKDYIIPATVNGSATSIAAGSYVTVHWNADGTNTATDLYTGTSDWSALPTLAGDIYLSNAAYDEQDYVQYGGAGQDNEPDAVTDGQWASGMFVDGCLYGESLGRGMNGYDSNMVWDWQVFSSPSMGAVNSGGDSFAPEAVSNVTLTDRDDPALGDAVWGIDGGDVTVSWTPDSTVDASFDYYEIYLLKDGVALDVYQHSPFETVYDGQSASSRTGSSWRMSDSAGTDLATGNYKAYVRAVDFAQNRSAAIASAVGTLTSETDTGELGVDTSPPMIMSMPANSAKAGADTILFAEASDDRGMDGVTLNWRLRDDGAFATINAETVGLTGLYKMTLPWDGSWDTSTEIDYYIAAWDTAAADPEPANYRYFTASGQFDMDPANEDADPQTLTGAEANAFIMSFRAAGDYTRSISGTVYDSAGSAIENAYVLIPGSGLDSVLSGADGTYSFSTTVADGSYDIFALASGYGQLSINGVMVHSGQPSATGNDFYLSTGGGGRGGDSQKAFVMWTEPGEGMMGAPIDISSGAAPIVAHLSETMDSSSIADHNAADAGSNIYLTTTGQDRIDGQVTYDESDPYDPKIIFSSDTALSNNTTYRFVITSAVKDAAGNAIESNQPDGSWAMEFTTFADFEVGGTFQGDGYSMTIEYGTGMGYPPYVTGTMPSPGNFNVPTNSKITVTFSEPMDATSIEATDSTGTGVRLYDTNYQGSGSGEYVTISVDLDEATRTVATITRRIDGSDGLLDADHHYAIRVLGSAENSAGITMADPNTVGYEEEISYQADFDTGADQDTTAPQVMGLNLEMYRNGSGDISSAGTLVDVPTTLHTIEIGFDKNMDPSTITRNNITLKRGTTLIAGTVEYRPLDRMATFYPSAALAPSTDYTLQIVGGSDGVSDLTGQSLASDYYAVFTTSNQVDSDAPFVSFGTASDYMLAVSFSEPMNAARKTDTTKWGTSVLNPANYTLWRADGPPPHVIDQNLFAYTGNGLTSGENGDMAQAGGVTIKYDVDSFTATLEGLQLPMPGGFMVFVNDVTDISGNAIDGNIAPPPDASFASAYGRNATGGPVEDSAETGKMMGFDGGMTGEGGNGMDMHMMGMNPTGAMPMSMLAGVTTTYMVDIPLSTAIPAGGSIVLTFPSGFDISGAKNADPNGDFIHKDINGPGTGVVVLGTASETSGGLDNDGITVNTQARTVTITLGDVATQANDYINMDIAGITNSNLPKSFDTSGYTVGIKTMANSNVLETMSNVMPFFLMPGGDYKISGTVTFPENVTGTVSLFGGSPMTGPIEQEITFDGTSDQATYEITSLPAGEYFIMTDPMVTMGGTDYFGSGAMEPIWITDADATKNFTFGLPSEDLGLAVEITGDFSAGSGKDADVDIFASSHTGFAVKTVTLDQDYSVTPFTATLYLPSAGYYRVGIGPAMPKGPMTMDGPMEMKFTPPPDINVEVTSGGAWTESSGTADDGTVSFTVGTSLSITGFVKSSDVDTVANAEVYAYSPMGMFGTQTSSAKDGSFSLNLPEGMYNAGAMIPGMPSSIETVFEVRVIEGSPTIYVGGRTATEVFGANELIIKLNQPERTISGKVTDGSNVVSYAPVWAYRTDGPGHADTMTDSSGNYILYVSTGTWNIGSYVPGFGELDEKTAISVSTEDVANINFAPDTEATYVTISGNISIGSVAQANMPIRAVEIDADGTFTGYQGHSQTNSSGDYSIKIKGTDGTAKHYRVDIWTPEYGEVAANSGTGLSQAPTWDQPWNVEVTNSDVADVDIVVELADLTTLTISFTDGTAEMQAYIDLMLIDPANLNPMGTGRHFEIRDLTGSTTVDLPAGVYHAFAHIPGYGDFNPTEIQSAPYYLDLTSGSPDATFDLGGISTATVSGTVTDESSNVIADAHIHIGNPQTGVFYDTTTASDGTYSLTMGAGTYFAGAEKKGFISEPTQITIVEGSNPNTNLTMTKTSLKISGHVYVDQDGGTPNVYDAGEEISDAFVSGKQIASSTSSGGFAGVAVDLDGSYELYVSAGDWQVFAVADEFEEAPYASNPVTVTGSDVSNVDVPLSSTISLVAPKNTTFKPAQGTTFDHPDAGLQLTLPPNAIGTGSTDYKVAATQTSNLPTTTNASVIGGKGQDITISDSSGAAVTTLNDSITIEQTFTKAELIAAGISTLSDVDKIVMAYWDESASAYKALPTTIAYDPVTVTEFADLLSVTYTGTTQHLSVFAPILPQDALAPSPPTSVVATAGDDQVALTWTAPTTNTDSSALTDLLGYEVYRSTSVDGTYTQVNTSDVTDTSYTDTTAENDSTYYYKVTAADTGGNESAKSSASDAATPVNSDTTAPTISSVTSTTADGSYNAGDAINVTVTFSEAVTLAGGNLVITLETGATDRTVTITSISSATTASGTYTVQPGDTSADLTVSSIALSAGTLSDAASNNMSVFTPGTNLAAGSAIVVDTTAPTTTSVTSTTADGSYNTGDAINVTVTFSEAVTLAGGNLVITLETGATDRTVTITSISSATTASGTYTVQAGDTSGDLTVSSIALSAGTLSDGAGNNMSSFAAGTNLAASSALVVDTTAPTITSVTSTTADSSYNTGDAINVTVTFSEAVTLAGGNLVITLETGDTDRTVTITSISSATTASGTYTVQAGDTSSDLTVDSIALSAGTLSDGAGNNMSSFAAGTNLAAGSALVVDTTAPTITSVTSTTADGSYNTGDAINVTVTFSEAVTLAGGNLVITLETGATDRTVTITSISSATTASGTYTVQAGDTSADLTVSSIALSAGTLSEGAGNNMSSFAAGTNLAASSAIVVDTTAPTMTSVTSTTADGSYNTGDAINITVTFSEAVTLAGGNLVITLETGDTDRTVTITSISSATTASGTYTVQAGDTSADLTVSSIALSAGTLSDDAGNNMSSLAAGTNLAAGSALVVDTTAPTITSVTSTTADGSYNTGDAINITVTFSEAVTLTGGNLVITLETGDTDRTVTIASISSATTASGTYAVQAGDTSGDLTVSSVALSAGTLSDGAGNNMSDFTPGTNLAADSALVVVTTALPLALTVSSSELTWTTPADDGNDSLSGTADEYDILFAGEQAILNYNTSAVQVRAEELVSNTFTSSPVAYIYVAIAPSPTATSPNTKVTKTTGADKTATSDSGKSNTESAVDSTVPLTKANTLLTQDSTPELTGTVNDRDATIEVTINGKTYQATNNGDGTWSLADDTIAPLSAGVYDVEVTVTDSAGNVSTEETDDAITIENEDSQEADQENNASIGFFISSILVWNLVNSSISLRRRRAMRSN